MKVENLKNYGMSVADAGDVIPPDVIAGIKKASMKIMLRRAGLLGLARFMWALRGERRRLLAHDYVVAREHGLTSQEFLKGRINGAATFAAMVRAVGEEKAMEIQMEVAESVAAELMAFIFPSVDELKACGDPFVAFKEFMKAGNVASVAAGVHEVETVQDTPDVYRFNVTYCAYHSIPDEVGWGAACLPSCYGDDLFFPTVCAPIGARFVRAGTIARGDKVCDFCFERVNRKEK